jgi:hypothetical protein
VSRTRAFLVGLVAAFLVVGVATPMVRFLWSAWVHAGI